MKIAVASQNKSSITGHAGKCQKFWIYEVESSKILGKELLELSKEESFHNSSPHEPHPLDEIQVLILGGMKNGNGLIRRLERKGIEVVVTRESEPDRAVNAYLDGSIVREISESYEYGYKHRHNHQHCHGQV
jgi:predicted Fe-Mo cluster-binding NifX family protein